MTINEDSYDEGYAQGRADREKELRQLLEDKIKRVDESETGFYNDWGGAACAEGMKNAYIGLLAELQDKEGA